MSSITIGNIKGNELPPGLRTRFNVKPHQFLKITIEVEEKNTEEEYDVENVWDTIIDGVKEATKDLKAGKKLPTIQEVLENL